MNSPRYKCDRRSMQSLMHAAIASCGATVEQHSPAARQSPMVSLFSYRRLVPRNTSAEPDSLIAQRRAPPEACVTLNRRIAPLGDRKTDLLSAVAKSDHQSSNLEKQKSELWFMLNRKLMRITHAFIQPNALVSYLGTVHEVSKYGQI